LNLAGPMGDFVLDENERSLVFLACDTGFAPVKSLIEHAMALDAAETLALGWLATRADGHYLANQCRAWAEALDPFRYVACTDADAAGGATRVVTEMAAQLPLAACDVYVAGPPAFLASAAAVLGVPAGRVRATVA
jgi:CDP-4-dehydro-6-deoxyglucose reductase